MLLASCRTQYNGDLKTVEVVEPNGTLTIYYNVWWHDQLLKDGLKMSVIKEKKSSVYASIRREADSIIASFKN